MSDKIWNMPLYPGPYGAIVDGVKFVEGRVPDETKPGKDYRTMEVKDILRFYAINPENNVKLDLPELIFRVRFTHHYDSAREMLLAEGLENLLPGVESLDIGEKIYLSFPGYSERVKLYGIYAIGLGERL